MAGNTFEGIKFRWGAPWLIRVTVDCTSYFILLLASHSDKGSSLLADFPIFQATSIHKWSKTRSKPINFENSRAGNFDQHCGCAKAQPLMADFQPHHMYTPSHSSLGWITQSLDHFPVFTRRVCRSPVPFLARDPDPLQSELYGGPLNLHPEHSIWKRTGMLSKSSQQKNIRRSTSWIPAPTLALTEHHYLEICPLFVDTRLTRPSDIIQ